MPPGELECRSQCDPDGTRPQAEILIARRCADGGLHSTTIGDVVRKQRAVPGTEYGIQSYILDLVEFAPRSADVLLVDMRIAFLARRQRG